MDENTKQVMFSSMDTASATAKGALFKYNTPRPLFNKLNAVFHFTLDAAATQENTLCSEYIDKELDALKSFWAGRAWLNPPYGRKGSPEGSTLEWIEKAKTEVEQGRVELCCVLIPSRTDTEAFQKVAFPHAKAIIWLKGRLKFSQAKDGAPFPSTLIIFQKDDITKDVIEALKKSVTGIMFVQGKGKLIKCHEIK